MPPTTQRPTITPEGKAAAERIAANRAERNANPTSVTADQLSQPVTPVTVPQPQVAETTPVNDNMIKGVGENTQNIIAAQTQEAADLKALRDQQAQIAGEGTLSELFSSQQEQFGIPQNMKILQDLQLQLSDIDTGSNLTQSRIAAAPGQTAGQAGREITQEQRENAVRRAGTAARAAIIQGNIETASALVSQAVQTAYQDRTLRNSNLINQINSLQGVVDGQTSQLLEADKREYEADQAVIQRVADAVDDAMNSGAATQEDIRTLTDPKLSDEDRLAAAQGIVSRGQTQMRDLEVQSQEANIRQSNASAANSFDSIRSRKLNDELAQSERANAGNQFGTVDGKAQSTVQASAQGYADRLVESEGTIAQQGSMFTGQDALGGLLPNAMQSSERQQFEQSKRNFINAVLRRESGAAIADSEFDSADLQYFPQRGDSPEVVVQKAQNRNTVINNLYREANVFRPVNSGDIIESDGIKYQVGADGQTLTKLD